MLAASGRGACPRARPAPGPPATPIAGPGKVWHWAGPAWSPASAGHGRSLSPPPTLELKPGSAALPLPPLSGRGSVVPAVPLQPKPPAPSPGSPPRRAPALLLAPACFTRDSPGVSRRQTPSSLPSPAQAGSETTPGPRPGLVPGLAVAHHVSALAFLLRFADTVRDRRLV